MNVIESIWSINIINVYSLIIRLELLNTNYTSRPDSIMRLELCRYSRRQIKVKTESKQFSAHGNDRDADRSRVSIALHAN